MNKQKYKYDVVINNDPCFLRKRHRNNKKYKIVKSFAMNKNNCIFVIISIL